MIYSAIDVAFMLRLWLLIISSMTYKKSPSSSIIIICFNLKMPISKRSLTLIGQLFLIDRYAKSRDSQ